MVVRSCTWVLPLPGHVKANVDGSSNGKLGLVGVGITSRGHSVDLLLIFSMNIGIATNNITKCIAILVASEQSHLRGWDLL